MGTLQLQQLECFAAGGFFARLKELFRYRGVVMPSGEFNNYDYPKEDIQKAMKKGLPVVE
ncbi:MAG: hypothetical protein M0O96_07815 [Desulforhopalus sp.]|nr:hypothetical protein [Desulforhopalus sp.]